MSESRSFVFSVEARSAGEFDTFAAMAARLAKAAPVEMNVSSVCGKSKADMPATGSPWHEYSSCRAALRRIFPHESMVPFVDMEYVAANQALLRGCLTSLRKHKLPAAFSFHEPFYIPEEYFDAYPNLRGARVDHPRRTCREEFAMCMDRSDSQDILASMVARLFAEAPEITTLKVLTNDAGAGICWGDWLYPGPNGPDDCRFLTTGKHVANIAGAIRKGAGRADLDLHMYANWTRGEIDDINRTMDDRFFAQPRSGNKRTAQTGSALDSPVRGIIDPIAIMQTMERWAEPGFRKVFLDFSAHNNRGSELPETIEKVIEVLEQCIRKPAAGTFARLSLLREMCVGWVGAADADTLLEALISMHDAYVYKTATLGRFGGHFCGVSMRLANRPLVALPEMLSPEEESYFLPHVFNPSRHEARVDYMDWHGGRLTMGVPLEHGGDTHIYAADTFRSMLNRSADMLEKVGSAGGQFWRDMAISVRMYGCVIQSVANFYSVQVIRDRNKDVFAGQPVTQPKVGNWTGDADLQLLYELMRQEIDNTNRLQGLLENGGLRRMVLAARPEDEDTFVLGPDIIGNLKAKRQIMRRHWLDAEKFLASPHK